ncbi:polysaccharide biosynthesis protein [Candidatus Pelagibacter sp.]|nr:polysaccharide biosynthesis protein [Candidatus Pelagibacter sp.]MDA7732082.1 polysaccharide biosynthesis protein [Candidatus Pelagibacter sp.]MDC1483608.1 polysaccharide biosynthesis protein [Pelagibacteraceae bacterium]
MINYIKKFLNNILSLHRYSKRLIAILTDASLCFLSTWIAFIIRSEYWLALNPEIDVLILYENFNFNSVLISIIIAIPIYWLFGLYRTIFRYTGFSIFFTILMSSCIYGLLYYSIGVYVVEEIPRPIGFFQPLLVFFTILSSRLGIKYIFSRNYDFKKLFDKKKVLIYGAGDAGRQLLTALENSSEFKVIGLLDDDSQLHRQILLGQTIYSPSNLERLVKTKNISIVFLALPTIDRVKRNQIIENLNKYKLIVKTLPSISEIVDGRITISDIKDLNIDDLLDREQVEPDNKLLNKNINSKTVLVTGAGGSIGSELCRQITKLRPNKLILLELNEFALYRIFEELALLNKSLKIIPLLVNIQDQMKIETIFETFKVDTVYHAAAYKHVSLVEENICEGVKNNVFGTLAIAKASMNKKVSNLVFISSDKAVRPTNIMGASKRLSELCMQGVCNEAKDINTNFSIVRFGNVLESSGSVIPKFKKQIKEGGPVTLTHKDVTRYFMTITEAAQLVIQAGSMGKHSEVFVLDMGKSIKIIDLIKKMINLSGFTIRDDKNPTGDIKIKIVGLRPGEKLYEELLIGDDPQKTDHIKIKKANDSFIPFAQLELELNNLKSLLDENSINEVKNLLEKLLKLYKSNSHIVDHLYVEKLLSNK